MRWVAEGRGVLKMSCLVLLKKRNRVNEHHPASALEKGMVNGARRMVESKPGRQVRFCEILVPGGGRGGDMGAGG